LSDGELLQRICGANDRNLKYLEELFGSDVHVRGNEVFLDTGDTEIQERFFTLISELEQYAIRGQEPSKALITAIYRDLRDGSGGNVHTLRDRSIDIPGTNSNVFPRSARQAELVANLGRYDLNICIGPAGTGKTFLAVSHALEQVLSKKKRRIVLTRPVVEAGENLGYLPGDLSQKISPYLRPLYDAIQALIPYELIHRLEEQNVIEVAPLAYMRGRSLRDAYVILDEAQNTTREQMKMFLTRLGENSQAVVTGDITQIDLPRPKNSGLIHALQVLAEIDDIGILRMTHHDIVRSDLVQKIIQAYDAHERTDK
jgi:phosphate starvation-inducible PhoH-like protein